MHQSLPLHADVMTWLQSVLGKVPAGRLSDDQQSHHAKERGNADSTDTAARCSKYSVAAKSKHFFARPTCTPCSVVMHSAPRSCLLLEA